VPEGCEWIGERAFKRCSRLEFVILPSTLEAIKEEAFLECVALTRMTFPGLEMIGPRAFAGCSNLKSIAFMTASVIVAPDSFEGTQVTDLKVVRMWGEDEETVEEDEGAGSD
jgi:hypothetical protein